MRFVLSVLVLIVFTTENVRAQKVIRSSSGIKPVWIRNVASLDRQRHTGTYEFRMVENSGESLPQLEKDRIYALGTYLESTHDISGVIERDYEDVLRGDGYTDRISNSLTFKTKTSVRTFNAVMIDNYWEQVRVPGIGIRYNYYTLYAVTDHPGDFITDDFGTTELYGARGLWRSAIVPGWGQLYKGQTVKGSLILGGCAALAGGIAVTEVLRQDCIRQISQTHEAYQKQAYAVRVNNYATARNVCIGAAAALYVYGLIDSIVSPGARRITVMDRVAGGRRWSAVPAVLPEGAAGIAAVMKF